MSKSEEYLINSEDRIFAALDNLIGALAILEGTSDLEADKRGAAFRMADTAKDELKALKSEFENAFDATFKTAQAA